MLEELFTSTRTKKDAGTEWRPSAWTAPKTRCLDWRWRTSEMSTKTHIKVMKELSGSVFVHSTCLSRVFPLVDIAVGAPYDEGGTGRVFIYHGSKQGIKPKPAQVQSSSNGHCYCFDVELLTSYLNFYLSSQILSGKRHSVEMFGYSLAGNMDLDGNSYPDVAVGSLSDAALIFR